MLPDTSRAPTFWSLVDELQKAEVKEWATLQRVLEARLREGLARGEMPLTRPERQLLDGLHLRERFLLIPKYAVRERNGPGWWISLKGSREAAEAMTPETRYLPPRSEPAPSPDKLD